MAVYGSLDNELIDKQDNELIDEQRNKFWWRGFNRENDSNGHDDSTYAAIGLIKHWAEEGEYFDIYQICAFDAKLTNEDYCSSGRQTMSRSAKSQYAVSVLRAIICAILQLPAIIFIIYQLIVASDKEWCNIDDVSVEDIFLKFFAFGFSAYVSAYITLNTQEMGYMGMYCVYVSDFWNLPWFLSGHWLRFGAYYNILVLYCAILGSFVIIFFAENSIDLVLNSVALFFVTEMDDFLVGHFDYRRIEIFMDQFEFDEETLKPNDKTKSIFKEKQENYRETTCWGCFQKFETLLDISEMIIGVLSVIAPFYIAVCY
eukprot:147573_1